MSALPRVNVFIGLSKLDLICGHGLPSHSRENGRIHFNGTHVPPAETLAQFYIESHAVS